MKHVAVNESSATEIWGRVKIFSLFMHRNIHYVRSVRLNLWSV